MDKDALEQEYCPPLDTALFEAILSDFDLSTQHGAQEARATLDQVKESAIVEQFADFEPSGVGRTDAATDNELSTQHSTELTDDTSLSQDLTDLSINDGLSAELERVDYDTKMCLLIDAFGDSFGDNIIKRALDGNDGNLQRTFDDMLNQKYLHEEEGALHSPKKGIEGFAEPQSRSKKSKKGKNARKAGSVVSDDNESSPITPTSPTNRWQTSQEEIDFIMSHTGNATTIVTPLYNKNDRSLPKTVAALLEQEISKHGGAGDDAQTLDHAGDLGQDFPNISHAHLLSIVRITAPSSVKARELARAYATHRAPEATRLIPQYIRPTEVDLNGQSWTVMNNKRIKADTSPMARNSVAYDAALTHLMGQARAMHRKGKSNHLYGGAAAYYSEEGRDTMRQWRAAVASEADVLAARQSTASQVDLHGLDTVNAVRIAREKTGQWWAGLGESRVNGRVGAVHRQDNFRIVVGKGTHSAGGRGVLGPAVSKMLREEGWRFVNEGAALAVSGR